MKPQVRIIPNNNQPRNCDATSILRRRSQNAKLQLEIAWNAACLRFVTYECERLSVILRASGNSRVYSMMTNFYFRFRRKVCIDRNWAAL